jgi:hypothetical protein
VDSICPELLVNNRIDYFLVASYEPC